MSLCISLLSKQAHCVVNKLYGDLKNTRKNIIFHYNDFYRKIIGNEKEKKTTYYWEIDHDIFRTKTLPFFTNRNIFNSF